MISMDKIHFLTTHGIQVAGDETPAEIDEAVAHLVASSIAGRIALREPYALSVA